MLSKIKLPSAWFYFASLYTCISLGNWLCDQFFDGSKISGYVVLAVSCIINWNAHTLLKKSDRTGSA